VGYVPLVGNNSILDYLPGVGFVPGFGKALGKVNRFQVRLKGLVEDPKAVKGVRWL
jgi:hypothetical protein